MPEHATPPPPALPLPSAPGQRPGLCVMVLGTSSGAGKSWLATALCAWYRARGLRVAPFKAQNMSNNVRLAATPDGGHGEIGSAQYFQALAAGARPDVRMNPLLLKPQADTHSQVLLLGRPNPELTALPWRGRSQRVWPTVAAALDALRAEHDVVVIEGAGSPAEINLMDSDIVNLRVARHAEAHTLLVTDIDRGGAFAHLYGTWALLPEPDRALLRGFVLNKFRGDARLLAPAPLQLQAMTGVPVVATIPMQHQHGLPEEDGWYATPTINHAAHTRIAVLACPRINQLDEFQPLHSLHGVQLSWARQPADLAGTDWVIVPGTQAPAAALAWLRAQGLDAALTRHAAAGGRVLGLGSGLHLLGEALIDPTHVAGNAPGLGLLPLVTQAQPNPRARPLQLRLGMLTGAWRALSGLNVQGHTPDAGHSVQHPGLAAQGEIARQAAPGLAWQNTAGNVLGLHLHGLFENDHVLQALLGQSAPPLESVFARMAAGVDSWFGQPD